MREIVRQTLRREHDFFSYLRCLHENLKDIKIFIAANNTPWGPFFSHEMADELRKNLGVGINLANQFRKAYIAIIDGGNVLYERLAESCGEWLEFSAEGIHVVSGGFESDSMRNVALIEINKKNFSENKRGLNFAVFHKATGELLDKCSVDTYVSDFVCMRTSDITERMKTYCEGHPGVQVTCFNTPAFPTENLTPNEEFLRKNGTKDGIVFSQVLADFDHLIEGNHLILMNDYPTRQGITNVLVPPESYLDMYGVRKFRDASSPLVNTGGGIRLTHFQPRAHEQSVFLLGGCLVFGVAASDDKTIASFLQKNLNESASARKIIVHNYGYYLMQEETDRTVEVFDILESLPVKDGDIVLILHPPIEGIPFFDMRDAARHPHGYGEVFFCVDHYTPAGYRMIADKLHGYLKENDYFLKKKSGSRPIGRVDGKSKGTLSKYNFGSENLKELEAYKAMLTEVYHSIEPRIGAVVMNCNPFTKGHRYLVEEALKKCSQLIVFVVQEDRSVFPFRDRMNLVKTGLSDLKHVTILPSGKFIISSLTFKEYFNKSEKQNLVVDTSMDVTVFAQEIAPCLHISVRFVGEEPIDCVTRQYNGTLKAILPQYGIDVIEIPRKKLHGDVISASRVRDLLTREKWNELSRLVPKTTLDYLKEFRRN